MGYRVISSHASRDSFSLLRFAFGKPCPGPDCEVRSTQDATFSNWKRAHVSTCRPLNVKFNGGSNIYLKFICVATQLQMHPSPTLL